MSAVWAFRQLIPASGKRGGDVSIVPASGLSLWRLGGGCTNRCVRGSMKRVVVTAFLPVFICTCYPVSGLGNADWYSGGVWKERGVGWKKKSFWKLWLLLFSFFEELEMGV